MNRNWAQHSAIPGSVKPVYGAQFPPLKSQEDFTDTSLRYTTPVSHTYSHKNGSKFKKYEDSVSDAWETTVTVDPRAASVSAARVLEQHAALCSRDVIMPPVNPIPSKNCKVEAMQRLATQKEPIPGTLGAIGTCHQQLTSASGFYPKLPETSIENRVRSTVVLQSADSKGCSNSICDPAISCGRDRDHSRFERIRAQLCIPSLLPKQTNDELNIHHSLPMNIDLDALRKDCWMGIPHKLRPTAWRILSGYLPTNYERQYVTVARKREEYWHYVEQYFHTRYEDQHQDTFRQIHIDIPRMCPLIPLFQQKLVQEIFERILYIWAIRHPASGYVQGINDLVTPFFVVFLSEFIPDDVEVGTFDVSRLSSGNVNIVEADSFWCVSALLDTIQDNYTFAQPGIQRKVLQLRNLMSRVDKNLHCHLLAHGVEYLQFAFRWMNNVLMREIPLRATIRLWDTYLSERNGFFRFHGYVCAAFLRMWSKQLQAEKDFQGIMILLQNLPTHSWGDQQICELTADAYSLMAVFDGAKNHLTE